MTRERAKKSWREVDRSKDHAGPRRSVRDADRRRDERARSNEETRQARGALEALFAPKSEVPQHKPSARAQAKAGARIVLPPPPTTSPEREKRRKLLAKLLEATSPVTITKTAREFVKLGFEFPHEQQVYLQLLEHEDEGQVRAALDGLLRLLAGEPAKRKRLLEQRLRRVEEVAESPETKEAAINLRRVLHGRGRLDLPEGEAR